MTRQKEQGDKAEKTRESVKEDRKGESNGDKAEKTRESVKEDRKGESNDSPETPVRGMTSNIPDFHSGDVLCGY